MALDSEGLIDGVRSGLAEEADADCPVAPAKGDRVTVGGATYKVYEVFIDTGGGVRLSLRGVI